ncbi:MAG: hypothetical protein V1763_01640 [Parcubacteria group bacterium]
MFKAFLRKNYPWLIVAAVIVLATALFVIMYPGSQWQLRRQFRAVSAMPIEHFVNGNERSCGIWYSRTDSGKVANGRSNGSVMECFQKAFDSCSKRIILLVNEQIAPHKLVTYSLVKTILENDQGKCLIQNFYEEQTLDSTKANQVPIGYVNTCTTLEPGVLNSCMPYYIHEMRKTRGEE